MHFTRAAIATAILATASSAAPAGTGATMAEYSNSTITTDCSTSAPMTVQSISASMTEHSATTVTTSYIPMGTGTGTGTGGVHKATNTKEYHSSMTYGSSSPSATTVTTSYIPMGTGTGTGSVYKATNTEGYHSSMTYSSSSPSATKQPNNIELSKTQQLFLADTVADRFNILNKDEDFIFNFNVPQPNAGKGGSLIAANRKSFPALVGTGAGMAVGTINACGINTFHVHPRSAELQIVTEGRIVTEMAPENGVLELDPKTGNMVRRVIKTTLTPYMMTPFYQGSMHTQYNPDCTPAKFIAAFASEDFGTAQSAESLFSMDPNLVSTVLGNGEVIDGADVEKIRGLIPASIAQGVDACLAKCGIKKRAL